MQIFKKQIKLNMTAMVSTEGKKYPLIIKSNSVYHPVMLFMTGGPEWEPTLLIDDSQEALINHYTLVQCDISQLMLAACQRSQSNLAILQASLKSLDDMVDFIKNLLNQEQIYLVSHSWASVLGFLYSKKRPQNIKTYIGVSQVVDYLEGEQIAYEYLLSQTKEANKSKVMDQLISLGKPPYETKNAYLYKWQRLSQYGAISHGQSMNQMQGPYQGLKSFLLSKAMPLMDRINQTEKVNALESLMQSIHFPDQVNEIDVPLYLCGGRYDYVTPPVLAESYIEHLKAPYKEMIWFESSGHYPYREESDGFINLCVSLLKKDRL